MTLHPRQRQFLERLGRRGRARYAHRNNYSLNCRVWWDDGSTDYAPITLIRRLHELGYLERKTVDGAFVYTLGE